MKIAVVTILLSFLCAYDFAQSVGWQSKDFKKDSLFGISLGQAYKEIKNKKSAPLIVAVIDGGIDTSHVDLKSILWVNTKEVNNRLDDDRNGYVDDLHGWNFIGGKEANVHYDNLELVRIVRRDRDFYDSLSLTLVPQKYRNGYIAYRKMLNDYYWRLTIANNAVIADKMEIDTIESLVKSMGKVNPSWKDFEQYSATGNYALSIKMGMTNQLKSDPDYKSFMLHEYKGYENDKALRDMQLNIKYDPRSIVGDNYNNSKERFYGNNDVQGPDAIHGTHVAGIIAAVRNNGIGIDGIADNVKIMAIRVVPVGDERDKDVANGIRYAVDNGAKIINMSFGKAYSWDKTCVDGAVKYAMSKDVLVVHAAGNDGKDLDASDKFPNKRYDDSSGEAKAWIEVGASDKDGEKANFSNYGKTNVDVYAPGVHIYSTVPGNKYEYEDGTSMAAPVVTGLAALIREYYPKLTAVQVKDIIMRSVVKRDGLKAKCVSAGIVNAYFALKLASTYK